MDVLTVIVVLMGLVGWVGTVVPVLPGTILIFAAALVHGLFTDFAPVDANALLTIGVLAAAGEAAGYVVTSAGAKRYGARRAGVIGSMLGLIVGLFTLGPIGLLVGPLLGAIVAEAATGRTLDDALRAGIGAALGGVGGIVMRFVFGTVALYFLLRALFL